MINSWKERDKDNKFWLALLLLGSIVLGWILTAYKIIWFGWLLVTSGIFLGNLGGLLDGWRARTAARKIRMNLDAATVVGSKAGIVAGAVAGIVVWMFVLTGMDIFLQHSPDASWSVSWSQGLISAEPQSGSRTISWSIIPFIAIVTALTKPLAFIAQLFWLSTACNEATVVGVGSFYLSILATMGATAVALASAMVVTLTVAKTKILATDLSQPEVTLLWTVVVVAGLGLAVGWVGDRILFPGFGGQLARLMKECP